MSVHPYPKAATRKGAHRAALPVGRPTVPYWRAFCSRSPRTPRRAYLGPGLLATMYNTYINKSIKQAGSKQHSHSLCKGKARARCRLRTHYLQRV